MPLTGTHGDQLHELKQSTSELVSRLRREGEVREDLFRETQKREVVCHQMHSPCLSTRKQHHSYGLEVVLSAKNRLNPQVRPSLPNITGLRSHSQQGLRRNCHGKVLNYHAHLSHPTVLRYQLAILQPLSHASLTNLSLRYQT